MLGEGCGLLGGGDGCCWAAYTYLAKRLKGTH